jgi:hypothetical protein
MKSDLELLEHLNHKLNQQKTTTKDGNESRYKCPSQKVRALK